MKRILVTGGAGFVGSHLVDRLLEQRDVRVVVVDDLSSGKGLYINKKAVFYKCDLRQENEIEKIMARERPEIVFHLAANAAEGKSHFVPIDVSSRNYDAFMKTVTSGIRNGMKKLVVVSSIAVYGEITPPFRESDTPHPGDVYGISKLAMERSAEVLARVHGFNYVIVRPHNIYGVRQDLGDPYRNVITIFMNKALQQRPHVIFGDGKQRRCFSYVTDVVEAMCKCGLENVQTGIFNLGADEHYSINELSAMIVAISGVRIKPMYVASRIADVKLAISDHSLAKKLLGYKTQVGIQEGLRRTWDYAAKLGVQWPKLGRVEIGGHLLPVPWRVFL